jgi:hypothetical protein
MNYFKKKITTQATAWFKIVFQKKNHNKYFKKQNHKATALLGVVAFLEKKRKKYVEKY